MTTLSLRTASGKHLLVKVTRTVICTVPPAPSEETPAEFKPLFDNLKRVAIEYPEELKQARRKTYKQTVRALKAIKQLTATGERGNK